MKHTHQALTPFIKVVTCASLAFGAFAQAQDKKADPSGTWTWTIPGRAGGPERKLTLKLKVEGDKLSGSVTAPVARVKPATPRSQMAN